MKNKKCSGSGKEFFTSDYDVLCQTTKCPICDKIVPIKTKTDSNKVKIKNHNT